MIKYRMNQNCHSNSNFTAFAVNLHNLQHWSCSGNPPYYAHLWHTHAYSEIARNDGMKNGTGNHDGTGRKTDRTGPVDRNQTAKTGPDRTGTLPEIGANIEAMSPRICGNTTAALPQCCRRVAASAVRTCLSLFLEALVSTGRA